MLSSLMPRRHRNDNKVKGISESNLESDVTPTKLRISPIASLAEVSRIRLRRNTNPAAKCLSPKLQSNSTTGRQLPKVASSLTVKSCASAPKQPFEENEKSKQDRQRSSRKSINGLVINVDPDKQGRTGVYAQCEDYSHSFLKPSLTRQASSSSLEELRTQMETVDHQTTWIPSDSITPQDYGYLERSCFEKQLLDALELSVHNTCTNTTTRQNRLKSSMSGLPKKKEVSAVGSSDCVGMEREKSEDQVCPRKSTIRTSIFGLVLEYDWTTDESDVDEESDEYV